MSYPNVNRQSNTLINSISNQIMILVNKVKKVLGTNECTLAKLRHEATNYQKLTKPEMLVEYKSHLTDYFSFGEEYIHTCIKTIINEKLSNHIIKLKAATEDRLNDELLLVQYKSYEDAKVQADLSLMRAEISSLDLLLKEIKAENVTLTLRITELETLTNELLISSAEDKSKIKSLEIRSSELEVSHDELATSNVDLKDNVAKLFALADINNNLINTQRGQIGEQQVQIGSLINTVETQQVQIGEQQVQISEQQVQIGEQQVQIGEQQVQIEVLTNEVGEQQERINTLEERVDTIIEAQATLPALYESLLALKEDVDKMEEGGVITKELKDSLVRKSQVLVGNIYSSITNLNYTKASFDDRSQWMKMVDILRAYLKRISKFGLNPVYQLQMIDQVVYTYYDQCANIK